MTNEKSKSFDNSSGIYVEKYLVKCLESILSQTFTEFECILVDDCSPDNSPKICDNYAQKDDRIKVIHKKQNEGLGGQVSMSL